MDKDKKKIIAGVGFFSIAGLAAFFMRRRPPAPPEPPPPGENFGRIQGYVIDTGTGQKIADAKIYVDEAFHCYSAYNGTYRTDYVPFGSRAIKVEANNYQTAIFTITLEEALLNMNLPLQPLAEVPTEWTDGVEVQKVEAVPSLAFVGEIVGIKVYIQWPHPLPLPADIHGSVLVNGTLLSGDWTIDFRNPTLLFQYTTTHPGDFIARAQSKSASFRVVEDVKATYFSPFGGVRMPVCTEITIPNVAPFRFFEGGDYVLSGRSSFSVRHRELLQQLPAAYPSAWDPPGAVIKSFDTHLSKRYQGEGTLLVMATEYDCQEYWDSKEELANMIAGSTIPISIPKEWISKYGDGKVFPIDLYRGLRDWVKKIHFWSRCGGGYCILIIACPYCDKEIQGPVHVQGRDGSHLIVARRLIEHIEQHSNHPLTEPAWF